MWDALADRCAELASDLDLIIRYARHNAARVRDRQAEQARRREAVDV